MIPLFKPFVPNKLPELNNILNSGALAYGKWGRLFEKKLVEYVNAQYILSVNSYNSAMQLCIATLGLKQGDEVIASPMSCLASNQPFAFAGLKIVWVDINPKTGTICPERLKEVISKDTKAIFHNHFGGYVGDIKSVNAIAKEREIYVIDDAIEAFGSEYNGCKIGNTGADATVFSFQTVRLPNTIDGGAVAFKAKEHYEKAVLIRDYGIDRTKFRDSLNEINPKCDISIPGLGATLSEVNSYIGCAQMDEIDSLFAIQRQNSTKWLNLIAKEYPELETVQINSNSRPNFWIFGILSSEKTRMIEHFRKHGFYSSGVHLSNTNYSVFGKKRNLSGVDEFNSSFIAVPSGWWINDENSKILL